ncbi:MAG: HTTM domain-containing protein [Flavobacteriaceae bacterium]|nr:HTTM domain-containing protein [Flavobacteriaceae bacterium]
MNNFLFKHIDNSQLIVFRMFFGFFLAAEAIGACFTGWIKRTLIDPEFTFNFIGLDFLQPLPGNGMYIYYIVMGIFGFFVMLGYRYRLSMIAYTLMWSGVYLMQKASYNNHYYLLMLLCLLMCFVPAHKNYSLDVKRNPSLKSDSMPAWCKWLFIIQVAIVYTYAAIAKIYPDWLDASVTRNLMAGKINLYCFGDFCFGSLLQYDWLHKTLAYAGIGFDLLIVPLFLWKPTRKLALGLSLIFHLFNAFVFQIGIFPFLSLSFALFFYSAETVQRIFLKSKAFYTENKLIIPSYKNIFLVLFFGYFLIQIALPSRHWFIKDDVLYTEEGHRLSWRMMLRSKSGSVQFKVVDKKTGDISYYNYRDRLSPKQQKIVATKPDVMWQFVQRLHKEFKAEGKDVSIYAIRSKININGRGYQDFIDPEVDLTAVKWDPFSHSDWILPSEEKEKEESHTK